MVSGTSRHDSKPMRSNLARRSGSSRASSAADAVSPWNKQRLARLQHLRTDAPSSVSAAMVSRTSGASAGSR